MILEKDLNAETLARAVDRILIDEGNRQAMGRAARKLSKPGAARIIAKRLIALTGKEKSVRQD